MSTVKVSPISPPMQLGEGPVWIEKEKALLFVDHPGGTLNRYFTESGRHQALALERPGDRFGPSVIIPIEGHEDKFLVGLGQDFVCVTWKTIDDDLRSEKLPLKLLTFDNDRPRNGLNDGKCDPRGRLWAGTKGDEPKSGSIEPERGSLYRIDENLNVSRKVEKVTISNGLTWCLDSKTFFYIDSPTFSIDAFDYDDEDGQISNRRTAFNLKSANLIEHYPDGMTIDNDGNLWVACYNGGKVICVDPSAGKLLRTVDIPSTYTTSCCFGGPDYSTLYVTSATRWLSDKELIAMPHSGKTFAVTGLGTKGKPHENFHINHEAFEKKIKENIKDVN